MTGLRGTDLPNSGGPEGSAGQAHSALDARVEALLTEPVAALGCRLLEARLVQEGHMILRLVIDRTEGGVGPVEGGVTLDDCSRVSEVAGRILDVEDPIPHAFRLEVTSPGVFRPLKERRHFEQSLGRWVRLTLAPEVLPERKDRTLRARLAAVEGETLRLDIQGEPVAVPLQGVKKARLDPEL
jgi:ribosome maturation factor RimP